jgi:hypothetical protein
MKRIVLISLVAVVFVACQDGTLPTDTGVETGNFLIVDGSTYGNEDVFFLPPLVPDPSGHDDFGDREANPDLEGGIFASICELVGEDCGDIVDDLPMEFQADFYRVNWRTRGLGLGNGTPHRITIVLGSGEAALELAIRDVTPVRNAKGSCKAGDPCEFKNGSTLPIKVRIETFAGCIAADPEFDPDTDDCLTATLPPGGSTQLKEVAKATVDGGGTLTMTSCDDLYTRGEGLEDADIGRVDIPTFGECVEITALDVGLTGTATLCQAFDEAAASLPLGAVQAARMTVHRFGDLDPAAVALPHSQEAIACDPVEPAPAQALELNRLDRFVRFARNTLRAVSDRVAAWVAPAPLWAKMAFRCHSGGCSGPGPFRSSFQAALPSWMDYNPDVGEPADGQFGDQLVDTELTARVKVYDSGEFVDPEDDPVPAAVSGVRLTVTLTNTTGSSSSEIITGTDGIAEFEFTVVLGENTVEFSGIGVGTEDGNGDPVDNVFAPNFDATGTESEVTLGIGTLEFTATGVLPDLIVSSLDVTSAQVNPGDDVSYSYTIANIGGAPESPSISTWDVATYLSSDNVLDGSDLELGSGYSVWTYALSEGWSLPHDGLVEIPDGVALGDYYLIVVADVRPGQPPNYYPGVVESNESNNWLASASTFAVVQAADAQFEPNLGTGLDQTDDDVDLVTLPFTFEFFGVDYTEVWVNANGNLTFNASNWEYWHPDIPDGSNVIIGPLYGDFDPYEAGDVFVNTLGTPPERRFVVTWSVVPEYSPSGTGISTFQVQLFEGSNNILFLYNGLTTDGINWTCTGSCVDIAMDVGISSGGVSPSFINSASGAAIPALDGTTILYTPDGFGGYDASSGVVLPPPGPMVAGQYTRPADFEGAHQPGSGFAATVDRLIEAVERLSRAPDQSLWVGELRLAGGEFEVGRTADGLQRLETVFGELQQFVGPMEAEDVNVVQQFEAAIMKMSRASQ